MKKLGLSVLGIGLAMVGWATAEAQQERVVVRGATVIGEEVTPIVGQTPARGLPVVRAWKPGDPIKDIPRRRYPRPDPFLPEEPSGFDPLLDAQAGFIDAHTSVDPGLNLAGQGYTGVNPPDTVGDVGGNFFVQSINGSGGAAVTVYDKVTGLVAAGPFSMESLATGGNCASGYGDPIVLFDRGADRWVLTEFAASGNHLCVYVSTTNNPTGTYCRYDFTTPTFPDYPKYGVWPDAFYVTTNESTPTIYALDRANMVACGTARAMQRFTVASLSGFDFQTLTPADLDGTIDPPAGAPGILMRHRDTEVHGPAGLPSNDQLELWNLHIDWTTPASSTLTALPPVSTAEFDSSLCGLTSFSCMSMPGVAQGSGSALDPLREVVMNRLGYRSLGGEQVLVGNFVTDVGSDQGGVRWFELRNSGSGWTLRQEGTYSPDAVNRWMGAIAVDSAGNMLLGYNASNGTVSPSLRYTGRYGTDPLGTMTVGETTLVAGSATNGSNRYGDYASMSVDPSDDCTFWFTGEYNAATTWSTRIGSVKFSACGTPDFTLTSTPASQEICAGADATYNLTIGSISGYSASVTLGTSGNPGSAGFSANPVTPPGASVLTVSGAGAGTTSFSLVGTASGPNTHQIPLGLTVQAAAPGAPLPATPANGATNVAVRPTFNWSAVGSATSYRLQVSNSPGFGTLLVDQPGIVATSYTPATDLPSNTVLYWRVAGSNACGAGMTAAPFTFSTVALPGDCGIGTTPQVIYSFDFDAGLGAWTHSGTGDTWAISTARNHSAPNAALGVDSAAISDQRLVSPSIVLPATGSGLTLQFWNYQSFEDNPPNCYDGAILEVTTNGGTTWTQIPTGSMQTDPYNGTISSSFSNPLASLSAWCGDPQDWLNSVVDISAYAGNTVQFRFRIGTDSSAGRVPDGWFLDDVKVQVCSSSSILSEGFESGGLGGWNGGALP